MSENDEKNAEFDPSKALAVSSQVANVGILVLVCIATIICSIQVVRLWSGRAQYSTNAETEKTQEVQNAQ